MNLILSLIIPLTLTLTALFRKAHSSLRQYRQKRCITHITNMICNTEGICAEGLMHLQQRFSTNTLHASFHTVVGTFRGRVIDHTLLLGEACGLSFHPILRRPDHAIVHISKIGRPLTLCEAAHLTATLVANNSPIAYTPLLSSRNRNLQLIGLNLVYRFGFIDAEHLVNHLVVSDEPTISDLAIHTLCAICGDMCSRGIINHFERLSAHRRHALLRHAVLSCYTPQSISHLLSDEEKQEFEGRVSSYKCSILCS